MFWHQPNSEYPHEMLTSLRYLCELFQLDICSKTKRHDSPKPSSVHIMTHIIRAGPKDGEPSKGPAGPLYGVHVDQSVWAARGVAQRWLGEAAEELLAKPRYQIINVSQDECVSPFERPKTDRLDFCLTTAVEAMQANHA